MIEFKPKTKAAILSYPYIKIENVFDRLNSILLNAGFRYSYQNQTHKYEHIYLNLVLYWRSEYSAGLGFEIYDITVYQEKLLLTMVIRGALRDIAVHDVISVFQKDGFYDRFTYQQNQKKNFLR